MEKIAPSDLKITCWPEIPKPNGGMHTGYMPSGVKVEHLPTGIVKTCDKHRSGHKNKDEAMKALLLDLQAMN
ncbi:peptide chain release factor-like protein [Motilimonas eburnea]|uniref:peptide chain release factor-like protein n=1 Tax=Motilimonas eburnea TaxID=1737488 RepID=UPI001E304E8D|nr:peptide chain release factor-like protein [Motilimonas eburnea]MCE2571839.1 hypothetical protein [Motilimonas eburnea]